MRYSFQVDSAGRTLFVSGVTLRRRELDGLDTSKYERRTGIRGVYTDRGMFRALAYDGRDFKVNVFCVSLPEGLATIASAYAFEPGKPEDKLAELMRLTELQETDDIPADFVKQIAEDERNGVERGMARVEGRP